MNFIVTVLVKLYQRNNDSNTYWLGLLSAWKHLLKKFPLQQNYACWKKNLNSHFLKDTYVGEKRRDLIYAVKKYL